MKRILFYLLLLIPVFLASCTSEELETPQVGTKAIVLHIGWGTDKSSTRALEDDSSIADFNLFAFEEEDGKYVYAYTPQINSWTTGKINITARTSDKKQLLLILANVHNEATKVRPQYGETLEAISRRLEIKLDERWPAEGENRLIPMCAIADDLIIKETTTSLVSKTNTPFELVRMLAKIDVSLHAGITSDWTLEEVFLYRPGKSGWLVYNNTSEYWDATVRPNHAKKAYAPIVTKFPEYDEDKYRYETTADNKTSLTNTIYTFETAATNKRLTTTALVVGLKRASENEIQYFRIDIKKDPYNRNVEPYMADIVRNVHYDININSVTTLGAENEDIAYAGEGYILNATVKAWTRAEQNTILDDQYELSVSHGALNFGSEGGSPVLDLKTNYDGDYNKDGGNDGGWPAGIYIDFPDGGLPDWLTITNEDGSTLSGNGLMNRRIKVTASTNNTSLDRDETSFTVRAGNMQYIVKVNQDKDPWLTYSTETLYVMDSDFKSIKVNANYAWEAKIVTDANANNTLMSVETTSGIASNSLQDVWFRTIDRYTKLNRNHIFPPEYVEKVKVLIKDPLGVNVDKEVEMTLVCPVDFGESNCYMIDVNNPRPLRIPLSQVRRAMGPLPIASAEPGFIGSDWIDNFEDLRVMVYWTSSYSSLITMSHLRNRGTFDNSDIIVIPGSIAGNCGIILYEEQDGKEGFFYRNLFYTERKDKIRWNWHIWISDYYPYTNDLTPDGLNGITSTDNTNSDWLDRNIGALSNVPGDIQSVGLYYLWGCKNPFETTDSWQSSSYGHAFFPGNTDGSFRYTSSSIGLAEDNLIHSCIDPTRFFAGRSSTNYDWYLDTGTVPNGDLWGGGCVKSYVASTGKSVYDPCPAGYIVPREGAWNGAWSSSIYGVVNPNHGGYYPSAGNIDEGGVHLTYLQRKGFYWTATPSGSVSKALIFRDSDMTINPDEEHYRAAATPIRCIVER